MRTILGPTSKERPILSSSRRSVDPLRRAGPGHVPHAQLVSRAAQAMRAHAKRCRAPPVYGSQERRSGTDFAELPGSPQSYPEHKRHCFEILTPFANFPSQEIIFLRQGLEILTPRVTVTAMKRKG